MRYVDVHVGIPNEPVQHMLALPYTLHYRASIVASIVAHVGPAVHPTLPV